MRFRDINWTATLITMALRAVSGGVVWGCISFAMALGDPNAPFNPIGGFFLMALGAPIVILVVFLPVAIVAWALANLGVPFAGLFTWPAALMVIPGDPLLFLFDKFVNVVPVRDFRFLNFAFMIWAYNTDEVPVQAPAPAEAESMPPCPYVGKVIITVKDGAGAFGFAWDAKKEYVEVGNDWRVYRLGEPIGFVDKDGAMHRGGLNLDGTANPIATFSGDIVARIHPDSDSVYDLSHNKIAEFWAAS